MCTISSPSVVKAPFTLYEFGEGVTGLDNANEIALHPFVMPYAQLVTNLIIKIIVADGSNNSDFGIYDSDGNLVAHLGAQHFSSTGVQSFALSGGPVVIGPGLYFLCVTSAATNLEWSVGSNGSSAAITTLQTTTTSSARGWDRSAWNPRISGENERQFRPRVGAQGS